MKTVERAVVDRDGAPNGSGAHGLNPNHGGESVSGRSRSGQSTPLLRPVAVRADLSDVSPEQRSISARGGDQLASKGAPSASAEGTGDLGFPTGTSVSSTAQASDSRSTKKPNKNKLKHKLSAVEK